MYCFQCQEASKNVACMSQIGVCGKTDDVAKLQDLLVFVLRGVSIANLEARNLGINKPETDKLVFDGLFSTITNANFDINSFYKQIENAISHRDEIIAAVKEKGGNIDLNSYEGLTWNAEQSEFLAKADTVGILATENEDVRSLRELIIYGVKGMAAYAEHAYNLGYKDDAIFAHQDKALAATVNDSLSAEDLINITMETGKFGVDVMALLDKANTETYGNPEITSVNIGVGSKPGILISGHDLKDLEQLLEQTKGTGVDVYTHCEMLPAHYYPKFKEYDNFVGNYGNAWWKQNEEFETFNGPIVFTTNCIVPPKKSSTYADRVYTTGAAGHDKFKYITVDENGNKDFSAVIAQAKECQAPQAIESGEIVGGFAHNQVLQLADKVVDAVKTGAIKKFVVMAGCDGRMNGRNYYTDFAEAMPQDSVILTAGCAKFRYNKLDLGDIGGIPRVLDAGQCNDSYSLAVIAMKLKEVFELEDINDLPVAYNIAWYEQKAVIVLLALLYLGVKNIHLGPTLPAFLSANVAKVLVETFGIAGIGEVEADLKEFGMVS